MDMDVDMEVDMCTYEPSGVSYGPTSRKACVLRAEDIKTNGNEFYKKQDFEAAIDVYTKAIDVCPPGREERAAYFGNRAACYFKLDKYKECVEDCSQALLVKPSYPKVSLRRAVACERLEDLEVALEDYERVLQDDPGNVEARMAVKRLPAQIEEKNEKLKQEMFGNLRKLGDMCLKPFGLSTNNFAMEQDPSTGSYNIKFNQ
eukprot:m.190028 g.190028  ORF g.190028 m.190028 type:complete len:203 (-) comp15636_c0_seq1:71-679(-)